jgi:hypothetical protein
MFNITLFMLNNLPDISFYLILTCHWNRTKIHHFDTLQDKLQRHPLFRQAQYKMLTVFHPTSGNLFILLLFVLISTMTRAKINMTWKKNTDFLQPNNRQRDDIL